ncbi:aminomethyl-transferring glycine dehydrogenase subunit GcvPB [Cerasicoccus arenae]|uniref:glycine dehydrogenase (aminomethyl-transferring) n=1 Tax=Cerasicoccus arenae TaxID=424488 RepID=A0A8J3DFR7_9BACT|nr:aminomethyl-transferring glycine dehydrogenase subunit GcvPB [Cerasicoccus arenae]MBK1858891.1 aminomethyl-transferring glycine dehydrogenase subunit GcvPB [Cerasicoccus arenae]GHB96295.1 putative glycine dehydrogenase (decarboxylating) subunit 2 [Cerasicoccus arenae]
MTPKSIFKKSRPNVSGASIVDADFQLGESIGVCCEAEDLRDAPIGLPELSEIDVVRHFTNLSRQAHGVDNGPYPLGSCTMKYNPKRNDKLAMLDGFGKVHPYQPSDSMPGVWSMLWNLQTAIAEITGMDAVTLQPAAGAHGEFTGLLVMKKHFEKLGQTNRKVILIPDTAHGTNPASAAMCGFTCKIIATNSKGLMDLDAFEAHLDENVAGLMITNPSTLGLFEENIEHIAKRIHDNGSLLYYDGANLNAIMGLIRPGDMGFDIIHINTHKTLSTPHGGGGPGAGPCGVKAFLEPYLPTPVVRPIDGVPAPDCNRPESVGKVKMHFGHVEVLVRAYCYILANGAIGLKTATENAVLNANYMKHQLADLLPAAFPQNCMHECLLHGGSLKVRGADFVKRLIDFGVHPPTLVGAGCVHFAEEFDEAMLIEPTETESIESLDFVIEQFRKVAREAAVAPYMIETAPHSASTAKIIHNEAVWMSIYDPND